MRVWAVCLVALVALLAGGSARTEDYGFDFFVLSQYYPAAYCTPAVSHECVFPTTPVADGFLLHGLWPDYSNGSYPSYCDDRPFDPSALEDLQTDLDKYWPDLLSGTPDSFHEHEWTKHGTCSKSVFPTEHDYFSFTLQLRAKTDVMAILREEGIVPDGGPYALKDINDAIARHISTTPLTMCTTGTDGKDLLACSWLGLDPSTLDWMPLPSSYMDVWGKKTHCNDENKIYFPPNVVDMYTRWGRVEDPQREGIPVRRQ